MDTAKKQILTECIDFFQDTLTITWPLLHRCIEEEIFSTQEGHQIWVSIAVLVHLSRPGHIKGGGGYRGSDYNLHYWKTPLYRLQDLKDCLSRPLFGFLQSTEKNVAHFTVYRFRKCSITVYRKKYSPLLIKAMLSMNIWLPEWKYYCGFLARDEPMDLGI